MHRWTGQQASGTPSLVILYGREAIRFLGSATAGFFSNKDADDYFPNDDFFLDINNLFRDMALNGDNVNATANAGSSSEPYVFLPRIF